MSLSMKTIKKEKARADKRAKDEHEARTGDIGVIHDEITPYVGNLVSSISGDYDQYKNQVSAAGEALKSRLLTEQLTNRESTISDLARLGLQGVGMGQFDEQAALIRRLAQQGTQDTVGNLTFAQDSAASNVDLYKAASEGQRETALTRSKYTYDQQMRDNKEAYDRMVDQYKDQQRAARAARAWRNYGGYGGPYYTTAKAQPSKKQVKQVGKKINNTISNLFTFKKKDNGWSNLQKTFATLGAIGKAAKKK